MFPRRSYFDRAVTFDALTQGFHLPGDRFLELATSPDRRILDVLFRHAREGVTIQGRDGLVYANQRAAAMVGLNSGAEMVTAPPSYFFETFEMIDEEGKPFPFERLPGRLVLEGREPSEVTVGYRRKDSGKVRWSRVASSPIKNDAGEVVWALNFFLDITPEFMQRERERILNRVVDALAGAVNVAPHLTSLTEVLVPELATWCSFHLLDEFDHLVADAVAYPPSPDNDALFSMVNTGPIPLDSDELQAEVIREGKPRHIPEINEELLSLAEQRRGKELADLLRRLELGSALCVPLGVTGVMVGTMTLARTKLEGPFTRYEQGLIEEIAFRAGAALANAKAFEHEHQTAEALRRGLVPMSLPEIPGLTMGAKYLPLSRHGHVGGDFYDVITVGDDDHVFLLGDVEGKGVEAAAAVGLIRQTLRATIALTADPHVVFRQLNDALSADESHSRMCTLAFVQLRRAGDVWEGEVALAGHPPPIILRSEGSMEEVGEPCPPAALFDEIIPIPIAFKLEPGDMLFMYSDGIATDDSTSPQTVSRLLAGLEGSHPGVATSQLLDRFNELMPSPRDDITALAVRVDSV